MSQRLDRYVLHDEIASGGMGAVHLARLRGARGFARTVAIKRLHSHVSRDPDVLAMFLDEAHLAARVRHPNVVATLDVVAEGDEVFLVMEYVEGESLSRLMKSPDVPLPIASAIVSDMLHGLHAAHEAVSERGEPLQIVHRDVSPQNILVGLDGAARVVDFGVAKAASRLQTTRDGVIKGKLTYMSPEQLRQGDVDRRADIYAASVVAWEAFAGKRMFKADDEGSLLAAVISGAHPPACNIRSSVPEAVSALLEKGLAREPAQRFATALEMATELERLLPPASRATVASWVAGVDSARTLARSQRLREIESAPWPEEDSREAGQEMKGQRARVLSAATLDWPPDRDRAQLSEGVLLSNGAAPSWWRGKPIGPLVLVMGTLLFGQWLFLHGHERERDGGAAAKAASFAPTGEPSSPLPGDVPSAMPSSSAAVAAVVAADSAPLSDASERVTRPATPSPATSPTPVPHTRDVRHENAVFTPKAATTRLAQPCDPPYYLDDAGIRRPKRGCY